MRVRRKRKKTRRKGRRIKKNEVKTQKRRIGEYWWDDKERMKMMANKCDKEKNMIENKDDGVLKRW